MCDCLAWNPLWATIAREARVRRPAVVLAVLYLRSAPDQPNARSALVIGSVVGMRPEPLSRLLAALRAHDVIDEENEPIGAWAVTRDVTLSHRAKTGAERTREWRGRRRAMARGDAQPVEIGQCVTKRDDVTSPSQAPSLSLFPESEQEKETNKHPRARGDACDDGFAELVALWPLANRMPDAEREYRRALRQVDAARLIALARHYLDTKEPWRHAMFLVNWLRTEPWRDPLLPLNAPLREVVAAEAPKARINWRAHAEAWLGAGRWPSDIGPAPDEAGCEMPEGLLQQTLIRNRKQHGREMACA